MCKTVDPALGLNMDKDYGGIQLLSKAFLLAVVNGEVDARALLEEELTSRGYDKDGHWIGCR